MKKHLSVILKLLVAIAGVVYICWSLTWVDQVTIPTGYTLPNGMTTEQVTTMRVGEVTKERIEVLPSRESGLEPFTVPRREEPTADEPRFKPGILTVLADADYRLLFVGLLLIGLIFPIQAMRWWLLLRCRGLFVSMRKTFRLTMVGLFFNFCMPGMTGGDVIKAYYAAKGSGARGYAIMSVIFDRVAGLIGLMVFAGLVGLTMLDDPLARRITLIIWSGFAVVLVVSALYFSKRLRERSGLGWLLTRFHEDHAISRLNRAAMAYGEDKATVFASVIISLPVHFFQTAAVTLAGYALGMEAPWMLVMTVLPVIFLAGALPISYQGFGVMEGLGMAFLLDPPFATANQIIGMLLLMRVFFIIYALLSSIYLLRGDIHLHPQDETMTSEPVA